MACLVQFSFPNFSVSVFQIFQPARVLYFKLRTKSRPFALLRQFISIGFLRGSKARIFRIAGPGPAARIGRGRTVQAPVNQRHRHYFRGLHQSRSAGLTRFGGRTRRIENWPAAGPGCFIFNMIVTQKKSTGAAPDLAMRGTILHKDVYQSHLRKRTDHSGALIVA